MDKKIKFFYHFYLTLIILLVIVMLSGSVIWFISQLVASNHYKRVNKIMPSVKEQIQVTDSDILHGCVYNKETIIISLNHRYYFTVKNNQIRLMDIMHMRQPELYPNIERDKEFMDIYWVLENCR